MLKILKRIVQDVTTASHLSDALMILVQRVRKAIQVDAVSVYLIDPVHSMYVLVATDGLNKEAAFNVRFNFDSGLVGLVGRREELLNIDQAPQHPHFAFHPDLKDEQHFGFLGVPIIQHRKLYGVLCAQQIESKAFDDAQEAFLITLAAQLGGVLVQAEATGELQELIEPVTVSREKDKQDAPAAMLSGLGSVPGIGIGSAVVVYPLADLDMVPRQVVDHHDEQIAIFLEALQSTRQEIHRLSEKLKTTLAPEDHALFDVYLRILDNDNLGEEVSAVIRQESLSAQAALAAVIKRHVQQFESMDDEYLRERANDFQDLGKRVLAELQRSIREEFIYPQRTVLVGEEVTAADLAEVPEGQLAGIVSARGATNSHVAILARALGIPTVMGVRGLKVEQISRRAVVVDGYDGQVYVSPPKRLLAQFKKLAEDEQVLNKSLLELKDKPAETLDGHPMTLCVNIGLAIDTGLSLNVGAEGVGLYRSEVPFMSRDRFPSEDEQYVIYRQILKAFAPRNVTMRTLDIGGDKTLSYFPVEEDNPYLGWRGIRVTLDHPDVFLMQIRAMMRASEELNNLRLMLPMITTLSEVEEGLTLIQQAHSELLDEGCAIQRPQVGVMIEVPAATVLVRDLGDMVDFISVGTNDLTQYLLAVDRNNSRVANLYDPFHPAMLRTLLQIVRDAHSVGLEVSICGEMASDPIAVILLLGMGFDALSMNASSLPKIKWVIRHLQHRDAESLLGEVVKFRYAEQIRHHLEEAVANMGLTEVIRVGRS
jgi:phosphotransferase system enzyme I (PtsP)